MIIARKRSERNGVAIDFGAKIGAAELSLVREICVEKREVTVADVPELIQLVNLELRRRARNEMHFARLLHNPVAGRQGNRARVRAKQNQRGDHTEGDRARESALQDVKILPGAVHRAKTEKIERVSRCDERIRLAADYVEPVKRFKISTSVPP